MMSHGGPYYPIVNLGNGLFKAEVVFIMPNMEDMGKGWLFQGIINKKDSITIPLQVNKAAAMRTTAVATQEDGRIFVSCLLPQRHRQDYKKLILPYIKLNNIHFQLLMGIASK